MDEKKKRRFRVTITMVTDPEAESPEEAEKKAVEFMESCVRDYGLQSVANLIKTEELIPGTPIGKKDRNGVDIKIGDTVKTDEGDWIAMVMDVDYVSDDEGGYSADCNWPEYEVLPKDKADEFWEKRKKKAEADGTQN